MSIRRLLSAFAIFGGTFAVAQAEDVQLGGQEQAKRPSCIEVTIDGQKAPGVNCLNQELEQKAGAVQHGPNAPPMDARAPAVKTGGFNQAGLAQQYGQNLGKSAKPYRPPAPVYAPPVGGH